jgi:hypothetical protein
MWCAVLFVRVMLLCAQTNRFGLYGSLQRDNRQGNVLVSLQFFPGEMSTGGTCVRDQAVWQLSRLPKVPPPPPPTHTHTLPRVTSRDTVNSKCCALIYSSLWIYLGLESVLIGGAKFKVIDPFTC